LDSLLAQNFQDNTRITVSKDGEWLMAWHFNQPLSIVIHMPNKSMVEITLPTPVTVVGWE
jgi:hypothetical protein